MKISSSRTIRRLVALLFFLVPVLLFYGLIIYPILNSLNERQYSIDKKLILLTQYRKEATARSSLELQFRDLQSRETHLAGLIDGNTSALAAAKLQSEIRRITEANGGEIRSTQNLPVTKNGNFEKVDMRFDVILPEKKLGEIIYQIEAATPYFFIDSVDIHSLDGGSLGASSSVESKLSLRWNIHGYRWAPEK